MAKAVRAIAKSAGFQVVSCKSESFSGGESIDICVKSELTEQQKRTNVDTRMNEGCGQTFQEPRWDELVAICNAFKTGRFDGMTDYYEYSADRMTIATPNKDETSFNAKWIMPKAV